MLLELKSELETLIDRAKENGIKLKEIEPILEEILNQKFVKNSMKFCV